MVPGKYDITIYKGGTFKHKITAVDKDGLAVDFSVYDSMRMQIRPLVMTTIAGEIPAALLELTSGNGGLTVSNSTELYIGISAAETANITFNTAKYDIELVKNEAVVVVDKFLYGKVYVMEEVTV